MLTPEQRHRLAIEVMGWTIAGDMPSPGALWDGNRTHLVDGSELQKWRIDRGFTNSSADFLWSPDQKIEQAMIVADKLRLAILPVSEQGRDMWQARKCVSTFDPTSTNADVASLAICLAALKWLDIERSKTA